MLWLLVIGILWGSASVTSIKVSVGGAVDVLHLHIVKPELAVISALPEESDLVNKCRGIGNNLGDCGDDGSVSDNLGGWWLLVEEGDVSWVSADVAVEVWHVV